MREIIQHKLADSLGMRLPDLIKREARLPRISGKSHAIIGMRRSGKTFFLYQQIDEL